MKAMNLILVTLFFLTSIATSAQAAGEGTISGSVGSMTGRLKTPYDTVSSDGSSTYFGLKLGYAYLEPHQIGFLGRVSLAKKMSGENWVDYSFIRPEVNIAYSANESLYLYAGANVTSMSGGAFSDMDLGTGFQAGIGGRLSSNVFIEGQYVTHSHNYKEATVSFNAFEVSVGTTF